MADTGYHMELVRRARIIQKKKEAIDRMQKSMQQNNVQRQPQMYDEDTFTTRDVDYSVQMARRMDDMRHRNDGSPNTPSSGRQSTGSFKPNGETSRSPPTARYSSRLSATGEAHRRNIGTPFSEDLEGTPRDAGTPAMPTLPSEYSSSNAAAAQVFPDIDDDRELFDTFTIM